MRPAGSRGSVVKPASKKSLDRIEHAVGARRRTHYLFWALNESEAELRARKEEMIATGKADRCDEFIIFTWRRPAADDAGPKSDK